MKCHILITLSLIFIFSACKNDDMSIVEQPQILQEAEFFEFDQSKGNFLYKKTLGNAHFNVRASAIEGLDEKRKNVAKQITKIAKSYLSPRQIDEVLSTYGQPIWDVGITCPSCTNTTMYFPFFQDEKVSGLLAAIERDRQIVFRNYSGVLASRI